MSSVRGSAPKRGLLGRLVAALSDALFPHLAIRRAEADARLAEERLAAALDALPEGIVFLDSEGRYILWNQRYAEIYHRSADLFAPGAKLEDTLRIGVARGDYPEAIGNEDEWLGRRLEMLRNPGQRHEQRLMDGRWVLIEERRTSDGGVIGLRIDITAMKTQALALTEALARAEAASKAKAEFLAKVSHELRTPLNGIMGLADVLSRTELADEQRELAGGVLQSAGRLNRLVSDLLDYNSLGAGSLAINAAPFDLAALARETVESYLHRAERQKLALNLRLSDGVTGEVLGDAERVRQILANLLSNALKFTPEGGVQVSVAPVYEDGRTRWRIEVTDTGVGFDEADAERLFGRFEQGDASATRQHGGVGLGLAICRQLAELMDGLEAIRIIRRTEADNAAPRLPIIVLSANTSDDDLAASEAAGADAHLGKPIRAEALLSAMLEATNA